MLKPRNIRAQAFREQRLCGPTAPPDAREALNTGFTATTGACSARRPHHTKRPCTAASSAHELPSILRKDGRRVLVQRFDCAWPTRMATIKALIEGPCPLLGLPETLIDSRSHAALPAVYQEYKLSVQGFPACTLQDDFLRKYTIYHLVDEAASLFA